MSAEGIDDTCRTGGDEELGQQGFDDEKHGGEGLSLHLSLWWPTVSV